MSVRFTPAQQEAIEAGNRELLVSAAAGSGKTAVLVERIFRLIQQRGLSIDRMLIVTFTRAAASEMRERLELRLSEAAGGDARMQKQADLVAGAQISTIHAFCQQVVRQHFQHCGVDPQFMLMDERTRQAYYQESMEETLDEIYTLARENNELLSLIRKFPERELAAMLDSLYRFLLSRPDPMEWLAMHSQKAWTSQTIDLEPMARAFCSEAALMTDEMQALWESARELSTHASFPPPYANTLQADEQTIAALRRAPALGLKALVGAVAACKFVTLSRFKPATGDEQRMADRFKEVRARYKDVVDDLKKLLPQDAEQGVNDLQAMAPATRGLAHAVRMLDEAFTRRKREQAVIDFGDLEHMTLSVLKNDQLRPELAGRFDAVFVDEYQDVSELQEAILNGLKRAPDAGRPQSYFYVGDVKQSIYRFRLAEPGLFLKKLAAFSPEADAPCRRIILNRNFRSKTGVLDAVNRVFEHVMDSRVTEIDYDEEARLYPGVPSKGDPVTEIHVLNADALKPQEQALAEAEWIARDIMATVGTTVMDGEGNPCGTLHYRDIAILMPVSRGVADKVELALSRQGVPVYCESGGDALSSEEVGHMLSHLSLLDNLMNDVALIGELRSPLFEISEQELAAIRMLRPEREASFLTALRAAAAEAADERLRTRCREVLVTLERERFYARSMPLADYLWDFLNRSGLYQHFGAQPGGKLRQANLRMLCTRAGEYEKNHTDGLHGFVETLRLDAGSGEGSPTVINPWEDVVRIMTIHKSKGLEFPTVYVMGLGRSMFGRPATRAVSVHGDVGLGLRYVNETVRTRRQTLLQGAIALREKNAERAERARVLYVALTRPKNRLVMVGSQKGAGAEALIKQLKAGQPDVFSVRAARSLLDWAMQSVTPDDEIINDGVSTSDLWETANEMNFPTKSTSFPQKKAHWRVVFHMHPSVTRGKAAAQKLLIPLPTADEAQRLPGVAVRREQGKDPIAPKLSFAQMPLKVGVTALCRAMEEAKPFQELDMEETAEEKRFPLLMQRPKLLNSLPSLPAFLEPPLEERGIKAGAATHRLLELLSLEGARNASDAEMLPFISGEVKRLLAQGVITAEEAAMTDTGIVARFLSGSWGRRMLSSHRVEREWSFNLRIHEPVDTLLQGVIDLCFLENSAWVLLDFKTDRVKNADELWQRYGRQLDFYRMALERGTSCPVSQWGLCALRLGEVSARSE